VSDPSARRGRRDNGLDARSYFPLTDVDPRVGEHLLELLREQGVAAYLDPTSDADSVSRAMSFPSRPTDRLYVDSRRTADAREVVATETAGHPPLGRGSGSRAGGTESPADAAAPGPARDEDAIWREIVAGWSLEAEGPVPRWPVSEDAPEAPQRPASRPQPTGSPAEGTGTTPRRRRTDVPPPVEAPGMGETERGAGGSRKSGGGSHAGESVAGDPPAGQPDAGTGNTGASTAGEPAATTPGRDQRVPPGEEEVNLSAQDADRKSRAADDEDAGSPEPAVWRGRSPAARDADDLDDADLDAADLNEQERDDGEHYEPPPPPPLPQATPAALAAFAALGLGALLLIAPGLIGLRSGDATLGLAILAITAGMGLLVYRLRDTPRDDTDPDDGAVV